ncbi:hypothetical protein F2P79_012078 [Pimephales promelas]|nr:hypothetical protein F2P79_012078 [Pimephales promelas]
MASGALRMFMFCLLHLCIQCDHEQVNIDVLVKMIQFFDDKLQPTKHDRPYQYSVVIRVPYQQCTEQFSLDSVFNTDEMENAFNDFKTNATDNMAPVVPLRGLIFLGLLHLCVQGIQGDVNTAVLAKMTQYFYDNVQPKTKMGIDAQYAIAISVSKDQCTDEEQFDIQTVFSKQDAKHVKLNLQWTDF